MTASASEKVAALLTSLSETGIESARAGIIAMRDGRVDDAIGFFGDAREHAYAVKAAMSAEKVAAAAAADAPLAGAPVTTSRLPRHARPSKNGHGEST